MYVSKIHYPVKNLGFGSRRLGIWFQGCSIHCEGCINKDTWPFDEKHKILLSDLRDRLNIFKSKRVDGVTITGGEPFDQPAALIKLVKYLRGITDGDIFVYSGYRYEYLSRKFPAILSKIDVLVSEPFAENETDRLIWRGSDNQKIHLLSAAARKLYPKNINKIEYSGRKMQFSIIGDEIFMIGIPARTDMKKFYKLLNERGVNCEAL
ncbi:MAG TPA: 4Fe-4S single cluster domain-containing protein [Candidatus Wallbacteria bacterium]|nr:4Fe-4S single cluster domain-containing protein [Candidatus Wallbacteria bacterium]